MVPQNINIVGTSHVASESVREIERAFSGWKPEIVAVELDATRLRALFDTKRKKGPSLAMLRVGIAGFIFALIGSYVQRKIGSSLGIEPGAEMKRAVELAGKNGAALALIDQPIEVTLYRFSKALGWREKLRIIADVCRGLLFPEREARLLGITSIDFSKVPAKELVQTALSLVKTRYPSIYRVLVEERNAMMARNIRHIREHNPEKRILVVVGAGHVEGLSALLDSG